jgi:hypothetical protein
MRVELGCPRSRRIPRLSLRPLLSTRLRACTAVKRAAESPPITFRTGTRPVAHPSEHGDVAAVQRTRGPLFDLLCKFGSCMLKREASRDGMGEVVIHGRVARHGRCRRARWNG